LTADPKHIDSLRRGPRAWNQWRAQNPALTPNLTGIALSVAERQMGPISGGPINFSFARLRHASLRFATLTGASLEMADLSGADLSDARLEGANLSGADLSEALLDRADFSGARFGNVNLSGASLLDARNLTQAQIDEALGDPLTVLPPHIARPAGWGGASFQVVKHVPPSRGGDTVSWLVGGPRRAELKTPVPQAAPERR
jgi:Pentapeptide repeats (8 copies)